MIEIFKQKLFLITEAIHLKIFGHEMSEEMRKFLGNLSISFFGGAIYSVLLFAVSVLAGRLLGPVEYGKYALYVALFSFLTIFLSFGLETAIVRIAAKADEEKKKRIISTFIIFFFCNTVFWSFIFFIFSSYITNFFGVPVLFILFALLYSITTLIGTLIENYLKILDRFVFINIVRIFQGCFILLSFVLLYFLFNDLFSLKEFIILNLLASTLVFIIFFLKIKAYFSFVFDKKIFKEIFSFSSVLFLSLIAGYLIQSGTAIFINKFIGLRELGFYNAYYSLSMAITGQLVVFFVAAYFPALAQSEIKSVIIKKIDKLVLLIAIPWLIMISSVMFLGIKLFGKSYPCDIKMIILFSLYSLLYFCCILYGYIVIASANSAAIRNMYIIWISIVIGYFVALFFITSLSSISVQIILLVQIVVFGINMFLNRFYCDKIANN